MRITAVLPMTTLIAVITLVFTAALADNVTTTSGLPYANVRVSGVKDGKLIFRAGRNRIPPKPLTAIKLIELKGHPEFNKAEKLVVAGKWSAAVTAYDKASGKAVHRWQKDLLAIRCLRALDKIGAIDRSVEAWLKIVSGNNASPASLAMSPSNLGEKGSDENANAIRLLERALSRSANKKNKAFVLAAGRLLLALYSRQGRDAKALALAEKLGGLSKPSDGHKGHQPASFVAGRFVRERVLLKNGKAAEALASINASLTKCSRRDLPAALLLRGEAQIQLARREKERQREKLLLRGGLNLMRVAVEFPSSAEAPEALFQAGRMHTLLAKPNLRAARKSFETVIVHYRNSAAAGKARKALAAIDKTEQE